ncbi:Uncharacterised protein [Mycobacterium tuberculosis]|uniref:Uncharacterized protein n=1 Tax=Mycobacterium tuberculosis TaxID=1773 RepID=A0A655GJ18_MYCTX|nr:hypothetical protein FF22_01416 [Mycobacterium tuberculosis]CFB91934.1 Uncharacterised protein [Mycobacterium tuberculosis]CFE44232.1 Uncharacterised protein [Mycobacterium tuberculosis]CFE64147.1 Uncharacterised protein [Mycobacterium tuberculosis]CFR36219.1 Uncharacterised protein [Mycobacterium tuberculosis]
MAATSWAEPDCSLTGAPFSDVGRAPVIDSKSQSTSARNRAPKTASSVSRMCAVAAILDSDSAHSLSTGEVATRTPRLVSR